MCLRGGQGRQRCNSLINANAAVAELWGKGVRVRRMHVLCIRYSSSFLVVSRFRFSLPHMPAPRTKTTHCPTGGATAVAEAQARYANLEKEPDALLVQGGVDRRTDEELMPKGSDAAVAEDDARGAVHIVNLDEDEDGDPLQEMPGAEKVKEEEEEILPQLPQPQVKRGAAGEG